MTSSQRQHRSPRPTTTAFPLRFDSALPLACGILFLTRFLVPAESADEGDTLWIVAGWIALAALTLWIAWRNERLHWLPGWPAAALALLVGSQVVSSLIIVSTAGQKRAALNMLWEWIGVYVAWSLMRVVFCDPRSRLYFWKLLLAAGLLLAGLGVWQRFCWYPHIRATYQEWAELSAARPLTPAQQRRLESLQRELGPDLLGLEGSSQAALRQRILDSNEPFARFGLANTLGGLLAVVLTLLLPVAAQLLSPTLRGTTHSETSSRKPSGSHPSHSTAALSLLAILASALIAATLLFTRSRTAWLAALIGLIFVSLNSLLRDSAVAFRRRVMAAGLFLLLAAAPLAGLAISLGAVDRQDLTEAPKSVLYRLQYWTASWQVIREHPLFGVGPGNFRQHYLQYKLPEASEEISDPHNLFFDVTATAGLPALAGLLWLLILASRRWLQSLSPADRNSSPFAPPASNSTDSTSAIAPHVTRSPFTPQLSQFRALALTGLLACGMVFLSEFAGQARIDHQLYWLAAAWIPSAWTADRLLRAIPLARSEAVLASAAGLTLTIHLLTSGGISMPVVALLLFTLWFLVPTSVTAASQSAAPPLAATRLLHSLLVLIPILLIACLITAWIPVTLAGLHVGSGTAALLVDRRPEAALDQFQAAIAADPLDPRPYRELSFAHSVLWQRGDRNAERHFQAAVEALEQAAAHDPSNPHVYRHLGDLWLHRARSASDSQAADIAAQQFARAAELYPTFSRIQADLSDALSQAGRNSQARIAAERALQLDDINHKAWHFDKIFPEDRRRTLQSRLTTPQN